jgi:hypothetical protein
MKNRIINGAMVVAQRGTSAITTDGYPVDRFYIVGNTTTWSGVQSSTAPTGFNYSISFTNGTGASPSAAQRTYIAQAIEGYNIADLGFGTASAKTITISFWVRSSLTGTFGASIRNDAGTQSYPFTYTISAANTWEQKSVTIAGSTTATWESTNGRGMVIFFDLGSGSDYQGTANAWASVNYFTATGATKLVATTGATFYITGVQLEVGSSATGFEYENYTSLLSKCYRYYYNVPAGVTIPGRGNGSAGTVSMMPTPVTMRTTPTAPSTSSAVLYSVSGYSGSVTTTWYSFSVNPVGVGFQTTGFSGGTDNRPNLVEVGSGFYLSAEL